MPHMISKQLETRSDSFLDQFVFKKSATEFLCLAVGCRRVFVRQDIARVHVRSKHYEEKPYICSCGKKYSREYDANRHAASANGVVYTCQYCGRGFTRNDGKRNHEKKCDMR